MKARYSLSSLLLFELIIQNNIPVNQMILVIVFKLEDFAFLLIESCVVVILDLH